MMDIELIKVIILSFWLTTGIIEAIKTQDIIWKRDIDSNEILFVSVIRFIFGFLLFPIHFVLGAISVIRKKAGKQ